MVEPKCPSPPTMGQPLVPLTAHRTLLEKLREKQEEVTEKQKGGVGDGNRRPKTRAGSPRKYRFLSVRVPRPILCHIPVRVGKPGTSLQSSQDSRDEALCLLYKLGDGHPLALTAPPTPPSLFPQTFLPANKASRNTTDFTERYAASLRGYVLVRAGGRGTQDSWHPLKRFSGCKHLKFG